jgi:hypothetical protein
MVWRLCWGLGYESGFGNGNLTKLPQDRLKDSHFLGANLDLWNSETTLLQATYAHAFNVTDGFDGLTVLTVNPLTGDPVNAPVVMRYTPSANLGGIHLFGMNVSHRVNSLCQRQSVRHPAQRDDHTVRWTDVGPVRDACESHRLHGISRPSLQFPER